jgi:zinc protease
MAKPQRFLKTDFEREREVILEELRKNEDSPGRQLFQKLFSLTYKKHPYGRPVIGYVKTLKAATAAKVENYYRRRYIPGRMGLIMVGPLDEKGARKKGILRLLEARFGRTVLRERPVSNGARSAEPPIRPGFEVASLPFDVSTPSLCLSFRVPGLMHPVTPALDLLGGILGMGELSRLYQRLFYETSLATEASAGLYVPADPGMLYAQAELPSLEHVEKASAALLAELGRISREGPAPEELSRVIANAESERLYATQTADGMASRLGFLRFILGDMEFDRKYLDELRAADSGRIRDIARNYLDPKRMSGVLMLPKDSKLDLGFLKGQLEENLSGPEAKAGKTAKPAKPSAKPGDLPTEVFRLPSGIRVAYLPRGQSHAFSAYATVLGGLRLEASDDWGASSLLASTWPKGTSKHDARAIAQIVEGHAASIEGLSGRNTAGLQLTGLARDWKTLSGLFTEILVDPTFPEKEIEHSKRVAEDAIKGIEDHSGQLCSKLFLETLFEKHPYGKFTTGSLESIAGVSRAKLLGYHRAWIKPERLSIAVSGAISRSQLDDWLAELSEKCAAIPGGGTAPLERKLVEEGPLKAPRWVDRKLGREQLHLMIGTFGTRMTAEDRHAVRLLGTLLSGQSGRLFVELREKKSLAYTVSPVSFEGIERGYQGIYIACAPQKREEALQGIRTVLEKLAAKGPTPSEMSRAREFHLGRRAMDLQSDSSLASFLGLELAYDIPRMSETELIKTIRGLTARQLMEVCRRYFVEPFQVTAAVG